MNKREEILEKTKKTICNDRQDVYGEPENSFPVIASYWSTYLTEITKTKITLTSRNVADLLSLFKLARITTGKYKEDNYIDLCGYAAIAGSLEEPKLTGGIISGNTITSTSESLIIKECDNSDTKFYDTGSTTVLPTKNW